jgi:membrane protease YdiL (CAAX protease family)
MRAVMSRVPIIVWSGILAFVLAVGTGGVWSALLAANLATGLTIPWAVAVMAALLWVMWQFLDGRWGPRISRAAWHRALRANPVPMQTFSWALLAGMLAIAALAGLWIVLFQVAQLPARALPNYSHYPAVSVGLVLVMASLSGALAEEAAFRGYFQGMLERRVGGAAAIAIAALVIAPGHAQTQGFVWPTLLFYLCVDGMLGVMAYLTNSILPGILVHGIGLLIFFTLVWPGDIIRQMVGHGDASLWFWIHIAQVVVFAALALLAFSRLARSARRAGAAARQIETRLASEMALPTAQEANCPR